MAAVRFRRDWVGTLDLAVLEPAGRRPPVRAAPQPAWRRLAPRPRIRISPCPRITYCSLTLTTCHQFSAGTVPFLPRQPGGDPDLPPAAGRCGTGCPPGRPRPSPRFSPPRHTTNLLAALSGHPAAAPRAVRGEPPTAHRPGAAAHHPPRRTERAAVRPPRRPAAAHREGHRPGGPSV
jgi:hypothetical protein